MADIDPGPTGRIAGGVGPRGPLADGLVSAAKGSLIGAANTIPGVSGGTIAVITGIYDRLIAAVSGFRSGPGGWRANAAFLAWVGGGAVAGILVFARLLELSLAAAPEATALAFIGLILGSLPFLWWQLGDYRPEPTGILAFAVGFGLLLATVRIGRPEVTEPITELSISNALILFGAGMIAAATMVIPGISGSFVLLLLGLYASFIGAVNDLNVPVLLVLAAGGGVGVLVIAKAMHWLLRRFHGPAYLGIIGLVLGSVLPLFPEGGFGRGWELALRAGALATGLLLAGMLGSRPRERKPGTGTDNTQSEDR